MSQAKFLGCNPYQINTRCLLRITVCVCVCVVHVCLCVHVFSVHIIFVCQYVYMWVCAREYRRGARSGVYVCVSMLYGHHVSHWMEL